MGGDVGSDRENMANDLFPLFSSTSIEIIHSISQHNSKFMFFLTKPKLIPTSSLLSSQTRI